jgi:PhnB protein
MKINAYLSFNGNCETALKFYEKCLGGKIAFKMTYGESPMAKETPKELHNQIMHARFMVGDNVLMASDNPPNRYEEPKGISVTLNVDTAKDAECFYAGLSEKAKVTMPLQETFWAERFAILTDQFGTPWMINCEKKD